MEEKEGKICICSICICIGRDGHVIVRSVFLVLCFDQRQEIEIVYINNH